MGIFSLLLCSFSHVFFFNIGEKKNPCCCLLYIFSVRIFTIFFVLFCFFAFCFVFFITWINPNTFFFCALFNNIIVLHVAGGCVRIIAIFAKHTQHKQAWQYSVTPTPQTNTQKCFPPTYLDCDTVLIKCLSLKTQQLERRIKEVERGGGSTDKSNYKKEKKNRKT